MYNYLVNSNNIFRHICFRQCWCFIAALWVGTFFNLYGAEQESLTPPLEIKQDNTSYNLQSIRGVPIPAGVAGSDGRLTNYPNNIGASQNPASDHQFHGFIAYGGLAIPNKDSRSNLVTSLNYAKNATNLDLPRGDNGVSSLVLQRASVGAPFLNRPVSFLFGGIIPLPDENEEGIKLADSVVPDTYWRKEPHLGAGQTHVGKGYYYSPHAETIFAIQAGPISITWRKLLPHGNQPSDHSDGSKWVLDGGNYYRLYTKRYVVSGSAVKDPQTIYWNTAGYDGPKVTIPTSTVGEVNIIYNTAFPGEVTQGIQAGSSSYTGSGDDSTDIVINRTLWRDGDSLLALNATGRVFVELLGDIKSNGNRKHLGFEIVDVVKFSVPSDLTIELGERVTAYPPAEKQDDSHLTPKPLNVISGNQTEFVFQTGGSGGRDLTYFAVHETFNLNDYQIYWLQEGVEGILWPKVHARYRFIWPIDSASYSHYIRPTVSNQTEAENTAVQLPLENSPVLQYQDALDRARGFINANYSYFSYLDSSQPQHRALIRYMSGEEVYFERVFSWLDSHLAGGDLARVDTSQIGGAAPSGALVPARYLAIWGNASSPGGNQLYDADRLDDDGNADPVTHRSPSFLENTLHEAPRILSNLVATVGERLVAPNAELGANQGDPYIAGHIVAGSGNSYHPGAYVDPLVEGFEEAAKGAIIPVNSIPGENTLQVTWFRKNNPDASKGFKAVYWPSVDARYVLQWPSSPNEIVMADNAGSGEVSSLVAKGTIYRQSNRMAIGYNPNEEHALMLAGRAYALRDDLNITDGSNYTSDPFVIIDYTEADLRPATAVFKVMREKPAEGKVFDYIVEAGTLLQAPMPLPLIEQPNYLDASQAMVSRNHEIEGDVSPANWTHYPHKNRDGHYTRFTYQDRKNNKYVYRGQHSGPPTLQAGTYDSSAAEGSRWATSSSVQVKAGNGFTWHLHANQLKAMLNLTFGDGDIPEWLTLDGLKLTSSVVPENSLNGGNAYIIPLVVSSVDGVSNPVQIQVTIQVIAPDSTLTELTQAPLNLSYANDAGVSMMVGDRAPHLATRPTTSNSFRMRFYYKNRVDYDWPHLATPSVGAIVPYLLPMTQTGYSGDPTSQSTQSLEVVYRPVWPADVPELKMSETLIKPKRGLPDVGGSATLKVLYQQAIANSIQSSGAYRKAVALHDPTRAKMKLINFDIPASIVTSQYAGRTYFPDLPPHLAQRFYFDPNYANAADGITGALIFFGEFKDETVGEKYLLLNVLDGDELELVKQLCPDSDSDNKDDWRNAVTSMKTEIVTFYRDKQSPGLWKPNTSEVQQDGYPEDKALGNYEAAITEIAEIYHDDTAVDSYALTAMGPSTGYVTLISNDGNNPDYDGLPVGLHVIRVAPELVRGEIKVLYAANPLDEQVTFQHTPDLAAAFNDYQYEWFISAPVDGTPLPIPSTTDGALDAGWIPLEKRKTIGVAEHLYILGGSGIQSLSDNYITMRYRPINVSHPSHNQWSPYMEPQLAEGWIKRVLAGINPFNQRVTDLFNNSVNTDVSLVAQAGGRWEGNIALNLENMNDHGLIAIYETVLNRGKSLSIDSGINYGPANDALLLAAGYLNDLYMMLGNEALADAANPTIGIGTNDESYGDIATAMFAFKGQVPTLLEEELGLLRGRDDFMQPGVQTPPIYNRFFWNYTRGIDSGEVIYALNYNIQEYSSGGDLDGVINAEDAAKMYPTGHGDAYGHFLTALKGYYRLFMDSDFEWNPRTEAVTVLGKPVQVDYFDERKFASAALALARSGHQVIDLSWRKDYKSGEKNGWGHLSETRTNNRRSYLIGDTSTNPTRYWGTDHWVSRVSNGNYINWIVGNAMLPYEDTDPEHEGIQKIDRSTVLELSELALLAREIQQSQDGIEAGLTPLGLPEDAVVFDVNPSLLNPARNHQASHFEQLRDRATKALENAVAAFDDSKDVTRYMRSEEDSLTDLRRNIEMEEFAYSSKLIEIYGQPYPEDTGPGKTYPQGYDGPDLYHFMYIDRNPFNENENEKVTFKLDIQDYPAGWTDGEEDTFDFWTDSTSSDYAKDKHYAEYTLSSDGFFLKPDAFKGMRPSPGKLQSAASKVVHTHYLLSQALGDMESATEDMDASVRTHTALKDLRASVLSAQRGLLIAETTMGGIELANGIYQSIQDNADALQDKALEIALAATPDTVIAGLAAGGDFASPVKGAVGTAFLTVKAINKALAVLRDGVINGLRYANDTTAAWVEMDTIGGWEREMDRIEQVNELSSELSDLQDMTQNIAEQVEAYAGAVQVYRALIWQGQRIQQERQIFRQRASALIQGYRTRDAGFRIFRSERLERYKSLFDLAATYTYLAAKAYDYETGLLGSEEGQAFVERIINSRALGLFENGQPQFASSDTGDPGLSSVLAEMDADWSVLKGRLGINNPDTYGTTVSLRTERYRIYPDETGDSNWTDVLRRGVISDLRSDSDVARYCMQIQGEDDLPVPGIVLDFSTMVKEGHNLFGHFLAPGDNTFSTSSFANKVFGVGVAFEGYIGVNDPLANSGVVQTIGAQSPGLGVSFMDPNGLAATPYIYLIPVGQDFMRTPPLGDASAIRSWNIADVSIPLPFNIGASDFSSKKYWQSSDSLSEDLFAIRKHQAFRAVSTIDAFQKLNISMDNYTNNRLIGRSVWNNRWKLVIPGRSLLNDGDEGIDRFIRSVNDIKLHFKTYSYSGN